MENLSEDARRNADAYGLSLYEIERVISDPQRRERIKPPWQEKGGAHFLYSCGFEARELEEGASRYVVGLVKVAQSDAPPLVLSLHAIPMEDAGSSENPKPARLLEGLAHGLSGLGIRMGSQKAQFFIAGTRWDQIPRSGGPEFEVLGRAPEGHTVVKERRIQVGEDVIRILLAFAVDATGVRNRLGLS